MSETERRVGDATHEEGGKAQMRRAESGGEPAFPTTQETDSETFKFKTCPQQSEFKVTPGNLVRVCLKK